MGVESNSSLTFTDLKKAVGYKIGLGTDPALWSASEANEVNLDIDTGCRMVYSPPMVPGQSAPYQWRFMRPTFVLTTVADQADYDAPDDFGGFHGCGTFAQSEAFTPVEVCDESFIRANRQFDYGSAIPRNMAATIKGGSDAASSTRFWIMLDPAPDGVYHLTFRYVAIPPKVTSGAPYPLGGALHSQLFLDACLAACEKRTQDQYGPCYQSFLSQLQASINIDSMMAPEKLTTNSQWSSGVNERGGGYGVYPNVTYLGVQY